ncbi:hypothetical protein BH09PSE4_BH09PSE4_07830 [soil metagenome]
MAKADRLEKLDQRRIELEAEYRDLLIAALRATAAGQWGLFEHNQGRHARGKAGPAIEALEELGAAIDAMRPQLLLEPFELHGEFVASRGPVKPSAPGEPKQAQAWLDQLEKTSPPPAI